MATPVASDAGPGARPGITWWCGWCVIAGVSPKIRREVVVESGASIDGSLLYGDLPALDGAETTDIADALVLAFERRPQHPKRPGSRVGVECAYLSRSVSCVRSLNAAFR